MKQIPEENRLKINRIWKQLVYCYDQDECDKMEREIKRLNGESTPQIKIRAIE